MKDLTKWVMQGGVYVGGIRMRVLDEDYDYSYLKSVRYKYSRKLHNQMLSVKRSEERDYSYSEYDCSGSTQVRVDIIRKGRYIYLALRWSKDV